jgi:hypothetical protein
VIHRGEGAVANGGNTLANWTVTLHDRALHSRAAWFVVADSRSEFAEDVDDLMIGLQFFDADAVTPILADRPDKIRGDVTGCGGVKPIE